MNEEEELRVFPISYASDTPTKVIPMNNGISLMELYQKVKDAIDKVSAYNYKYRLDSYIDMKNGTVLSDDYNMVKNFVILTGLIDKSITIRDDFKQQVLYDPILDNVTQGKTASDTPNEKLETLGLALFGDLVFFDSYQKFGSVGIYLDNGEFLTVSDLGKETNNLVIKKMYTEDEFGELEYTDSLQEFNGTIKRIPRLNEDDYRWQLETYGIED